MDAFLGIKHDKPSGFKSMVSDKNDIQIFPNPVTHETLTIKLNKTAVTTQIIITSVNGQPFYEENTDENVVVFSNLKLPAGLYFIQIRNEELKEIRALIVE